MMSVAQLHAAPQREVRHAFPLPHTPGTVSAVRGRVRAVLSGWNVPA